jgi:hypothetical protein
VDDAEETDELEVQGETPPGNPQAHAWPPPWVGQQYAPLVHAGGGPPHRVLDWLELLELPILLPPKLLIPGWVESTLNQISRG